MTKFILHGGNSNKKSQENENFFFEIIDSIEKDKVSILCVYFARPEHRWEDSFDEDQTIFLSLETKKELEIKMAVLDKKEFVQQVEDADVVFLCGGRKGCLKDFLLNLGNFDKLIEGKVVVGSSAGVNILSKYYFSNGDKIVKEGIGLLPIKAFCHFSEKSSKEFKLLENYKEKLPLYTIPEEKYIVIEI